jgi:hypothetical protein
MPIVVIRIKFYVLVDLIAAFSEFMLLRLGII